MGRLIALDAAAGLLRGLTRILIASALAGAALAGCGAGGSPGPTQTANPVSAASTPAPAAVQTTAPPAEPTPTVGPGGFPRRFHVEGSSFVDQFGQATIFRGLATPDIVQMAQRVNPRLSEFTERYFEEMASWGANVVRIAIAPMSLRSGVNQVLPILDQAVAWAGQHRMYVIIDFHSAGWFPDNWFVPNSGNETTVAEWTSFWEAVSQRYADNDVVAFYEVFNEAALNTHWPYTRQDWLSWKSLVEGVVNDAIRPNDRHKIVLVGGLQSSYDLEYASDAPITDVSNNVAYVTHPYPGQFLPGENRSTLAGWDAAFGRLSRQHPVVATEFGYEEGVVEDVSVDGVPYHKAIVDYFEAHGISWTAWCFDAEWATRLLKNNQTFEPSESGTYFRSRLLELNR